MFDYMAGRSVQEGGIAKIPLWDFFLGEYPLSVESEASPHSARDSRNKILGIFWKLSGLFGEISGICRNFRGFLALITINNRI